MRSHPLCIQRKTVFVSLSLSVSFSLHTHTHTHTHEHDSIIWLLLISQESLVQSAEHSGRKAQEDGTALPGLWFWWYRHPHYCSLASVHLRSPPLVTSFQVTHLNYVPQLNCVKNLTVPFFQTSHFPSAILLCLWTELNPTAQICCPPWVSGQWRTWTMCAQLQGLQLGICPFILR